jgi:hypothetical protein
MKPSSASPKNLEPPLADFDLEPVDEPPVRRLPPLVSLEEMMGRIRQLREGFPEGIRSAGLIKADTIEIELVDASGQAAAHLARPVSLNLERPLK